MSNEKQTNYNQNNNDYDNNFSSNSPEISNNKKSSPSEQKKSNTVSESKNSLGNSNNKNNFNSNNTKENNLNYAGNDFSDGFKDKAKNISNEMSNEVNPLGTVNEAKNLAKEVKNTASELASGDLYGGNQDGFSQTVNDIKDVGIGTAKAAGHAASAVGRGLAGDVNGAVQDGMKAVKDVVKIFTSVLRLLLPILFIIIIFISIFLSAPAMIWGNLTDKYEKWTINEAVNAINCGIDDAAWQVVDNLSDDIDDFIGVKNNTTFKKMCNQYYFDYAGNGYVKEYDDGSSLSITMELSDDGTHQNAIILYTNPKGVNYEITYLNADTFVSEVNSEVSYSEIINAFNMYRQNKAETNSGYKICSQFTEKVQKNIEDLGETFYEDTSTAIAKAVSYVSGDKSTTDELSEISKLTSLSKNSDGELDPSEVWGLEDTSAIYYYMMTDKGLQNSLYSYKCILGDDAITIDSTNSKTSVKKNRDKGKVEDGTYKMTIDVNTFDTEDATSSSGETYSTDVMNGFGITEPDDIEKVITTTEISNALLDSAVQSVDVGANYSEYLTVSQSKSLYEKIVGSPSVLEKMIDQGLYADVTENKIREIFAETTSTYSARSRNHGADAVTEQNFIFRTKDQYSDAFEGTAMYYINKNGKYVESKAYQYNDLTSHKNIGEDGTFVTFMYWKSIYAGNLPNEDGEYDGLKPRTYIFPEIYNTKKGKTKEKKVVTTNMFCSEEYYQYFQKYSPSSYFSLTESNGKVKKDAVETAFKHETKIKNGKTTITVERDKNGKTKAIQKGDLIFLTYYSLSTFPVCTFGNRAYQVGIVTKVNYDEQKIVVAVYNYDDDPIKEFPVENMFDTKFQKKIGINGLEVTDVVIDFKNQTITPQSNDIIVNVIDKINNLADTKIKINPLAFISGYAKPNYQAYVDEINKRCAAKREEMNSLIDSAYDTGGGTLAYPTTYRKISAGWPNYKSGRYHGGVDFPCPVGTKVHACDDGIVITSKSLGNESYGKYIVIRHNDGRCTVYAHLSKLIAKVGDTVTRGQLIGLSGSTGNSTGPHLHLEYRTRKNSSNDTLNPLIYLKDSKKFKYKGYTFYTGVMMDKSPINTQNIIVTFYDSCSICNGPWGAKTKSGKLLKDKGKYYDSGYNFVACNWLPQGTKIKIYFPKSSELKSLSGKSYIYTVEDTGSASRLSTHCIDVFVPNSHSKTESLGKHKVKIMILNEGKK